MPLKPTYTSTADDLPHIAEAILTPKNMDGGQDATLNPPGFAGGGCPHHHQRGHMIGNNIGGRNEKGNIVTLTDGSNHPYMFALERIVRNIVLKTQKQYKYTVTANYSKDLYTKSPNNTLYGALGNPYCAYPCPGALMMSLEDQNGTKMFTLENLRKYDDPHYATEAWRQNMLHAGNVIIANGMYKQHINTDHHETNCPSLVSNAVEQIRCTVCKAAGGTVAREPSVSEWIWPFTCWHWCKGCGRNWCPVHGRALKAWGMFTLSRTCPNCKQYTQLFCIDK